MDVPDPELFRPYQISILAPVAFCLFRDAHVTPPPVILDTAVVLFDVNTAISALPAAGAAPNVTVQVVAFPA
jgi:hypothetical protein